MRKFIVIAVLLLITLQAHATFTAQDYLDGKTYLGSGNKLLDPLYLFIADSAAASTVGKEFFFFLPGTTSYSIEGYMWYDSTGDVIKYRSASATVTLSGVGPGESGTLDDAYNSGFAIDVDGTAVTLTVGLGDDNAALIVNANDATNNANGIEVVVAASNTGAGLFVDGTTGTIDLLGDNFSMANTGILTMTSGDAIDNSTTDDIFQFSSNDKEDFSIDLSGTNIIGFSSDTSAITLEFNALDRLTGLEDITFDAEAANILLTADAGAEDLSIAQLGTVDASLILTGAGTGVDALSLITNHATGVMKIASGYKIDVDAVNTINIDISGAGADLDIDSAAGSIYLDSGQADAKAIWLATTDAAGGIDMDVGSGSLDIDVTAGDITIDNDGAGKNLDIDISAGSIYLDAGEADPKGIWLVSAGGIDIDLASTYDFDLDAVGGKILLTATENAVNTIHLEENSTGGAGTINLYANQGTGVAAATQHDASIQLQSDVGGIGLYTTSNQGEDIRIETNGGSDEFITIHSNQGTGADSVTLLSDVGGIAVTATAGSVVVTGGGASGDITLAAGDEMVLTSADIKFFGGAVTEVWEIEGTANDHETQISFTDPSADVIWTFPAAAADTFAVMASTLATNAPEIANSVTGGTGQLIFEGTIADAHETTIAVNNATADAIISLPDDTGDILYAAPGAVDYAAGPGALPITHVQITLASQGGAEALSIPDGVPGQILQINHDDDGGNSVVTPDTATGYTSIDLADAGDMVTFMFVDTVGWIILGTAGNAAPPAVTP